MTRCRHCRRHIKYLTRIIPTNGMRVCAWRHPNGRLFCGEKTRTIAEPA